MAGRKSTYFIIPSILLAFSVAFVLSFWIGTFSTPYMMTCFSLHFYMSVLFIVSIAVMLRYTAPFQFRDVGRRPSYIPEVEGKTVISVVAKGSAVVFLMGALLLDTISVMAILDCANVWTLGDCESRTPIMTAIFLILKALFMGMQVMLLSIEGDRYARCGKSTTPHHVYIINAIVNTTVVVYSLLYESIPAEIRRKEAGLICLGFTKDGELPRDNETDLSRHQKHCLRETTTMFKINHSIGAYLYPFHSEFCILSTTLNLILCKLKLAERVENPAVPRQGRRGICNGRKADDHLSPGEEESVVLIDGKNEQMESCLSITNPRLAIQVEEGGESEHDYGTSEEQNSNRTGRAPNTSLHIRRNDTGYHGMGEGAAQRYGSIEPARRNHNQRSKPFKPWSPFRECMESGGCIDPRPSYIYGPDNGCGFMAFIGFALVCIYTVMILFLQFKYLTGVLFTPLYYLTVILLTVTLLASVLLSIGTSKKLELGPPASRNLSVGSMVLVLSAFSLFVFKFLESIAAWNMFTNPRFNLTDLEEKNHMSHFVPHKGQLPISVQVGLDIYLSAADCIHVAFQTNLIFNIHWLMKRNCFDDAICTSTMMQCTSFLLAVNLSRWIVGTFVEAYHPELNYIQSLYFGVQSWSTMVTIFSPFVIYYRFHCVLALAEYMIWRRGLLLNGRNSNQQGAPKIGTLANY